jgi:predicted GNAT family acetyltransferase
MKLLHKFLYCDDDDFRDSRLKIVPVCVQGMLFYASVYNGEMQ